MSLDSPALVEFADISLHDLDGATESEVDALRFGVVGLSADNLIRVYNSVESGWAGLARDAVMGTHFFTNVAQCMNNYMIAQRFEDEQEIDSILDYVLTFRMRTTPVRLRLLKGPAARLRYVLIQR